MSHEFDTGFTVREPAWHGLGITLDEHPENWAEARKHAGLLWEPAEDVIYRRVRIDAATAVTIPGAILTADPEVALVPLVNHKLITRNDSGAELAVQRTEFPLIHHATMGEILDAVAEASEATFKFETAGSLQGGRKVWALARLDEPFQIPGDSSLTFPYFALTNAHDGEGACRVIPTQVRIVCQNTWKAADAEANRHGFEVVIRHVGNVEERIEEAKRTLVNAREAAKSYEIEMAHLAGLNYSDAVLERFLEEFIPTPEGKFADWLPADRAAKRNVCRRMLLESPTLADLPNTAYKLVQLSGEYLDHLRRLPSDEVERKDSYLKRTLLGYGPGDGIKANMIQVARELCTVGV